MLHHKGISAFQNKIMKILSVLFLSVFLMSCSSKKRSENLDKNELKITTAKAINLIRQKDYAGFKSMFAPEIAKDIPPEQMNKLVDQLNDFLRRKEFPDAENIVFEESENLVNNDTVTVNNIIYKFDNPAHSLHSYSRYITFTFMPKYGSDKLCGVHLMDDKPYP